MMTSAGKSKLIKVILLGDGGVGKTSLMAQFVSGEFRSATYHTVGVEFLNKDMEQDGQLYTLQIWDTAGQERFKSLRTPFYRGADICLLTFAMDDKHSFANLETWKQEFMYYADVQTEQFPFVLLGNKSDLSDAGTSSEAINKWCANHGEMPFFRTSAKTAENVSEAFHAAVKVYRELEDTERFQPEYERNGVDMVKINKKKACPCS